MSLREVSPVSHAKGKPTKLLLEQRYPVSGVLSLNLMLLNQCTHTGMNEIMHSTCAFLLYHGIGVGGREVGEGWWGVGGS